MKGFIYLLVYPFIFVSCLLTTWVFQLFWITFEFNKVITETIGLELPGNLNEPTYWQTFWLLMAFGFLKFMFFGTSIPNFNKGSSSD